MVILFSSPYLQSLTGKNRENKIYFFCYFKEMGGCFPKPLVKTSATVR